MANYDVEHSIILKFVKSLNNYFPFLKESYSSFYLDYYKSSLNSIKTCLFRSKSENVKILQKMKNVKQNKPLEDNVEINQIQSDKNKMQTLILKNCLSFLDTKHKVDLLHLNKNLNIKKYYYESFLERKELSKEKRIKIWQIILLNKEANNVNYKEILKDLNEIEDSKVKNSRNC